MIIKGIGTDIIEISRIQKVLEKREGKFQHKFFTSQEREYCLKHRNPYQYFAVRFAAKEAVVKALGTGFRNMEFTDIEVVNGEGGKPYISLQGKAREISAQLGIKEVQVTLSHSRDYAVAFALAVG